MRLFIFDMGGVVALNVHCVAALAQYLGLTTEEFFMAAGGAPGSAYNGGDVRAIQDGSVGPEEFWLRLENRAAELFPLKNVRVPRDREGNPVDLWGSFFNPQRDAAVVTLICELKARGYRVVCGTNTLPAHYGKHQELGDYDSFDRVYASHRMGTAKPDAEFWNMILRTEGIAPQDSYFIDDLKENVAAAEALGIRGHHFVSPRALRAALMDSRFIGNGE